MCRALFVQNDKADIIHRIPLTSSNRFSFPAYTHCIWICTPTIIYRDMLPTIYRMLLWYTCTNPCVFLATSRERPNKRGTDIYPHTSFLPEARLRLTTRCGVKLYQRPFFLSRTSGSSTPFCPIFGRCCWHLFLPDPDRNQNTWTQPTNLNIPSPRFLKGPRLLSSSVLRPRCTTIEGGLMSWSAYAIHVRS